MRRRARRVESIEDDGFVLIRGQLVPPEWAEWNAQHHMAGFDSLPKSLRDKINYAETPETGALPTCDIVQRYDIEGRREQAREVARAMIKRALADDA